VIRNSQRLNYPIDYQKFISFIAILVKGTSNEKLALIFSIFGKGISEEDMNKFQDMEDKDSSQSDGNSQNDDDYDDEEV
jgi:hypothetical protein